MELISWNIQWGRGADGRVDLSRSVATLRAMADADVICLQEVTRGFGDLRGAPGADQVTELVALLPGYQLLFAPGVDRFGSDGGPRQFGNLIATRLPVHEVFRHALPWPADPDVASMPRVALEVTVQSGSKRLRVICTHLEYYSASQRAAQADACATGTPRPAATPAGPVAANRPRAPSRRRPGHRKPCCAATSTASLPTSPTDARWSPSTTAPRHGATLGCSGIPASLTRPPAACTTRSNGPSRHLHAISSLSRRISPARSADARSTQRRRTRITSPSCCHWISEPGGPRPPGAGRCLSRALRLPASGASAGMPGGIPSIARPAVLPGIPARVPSRDRTRAASRLPA